MNNNSMSEILGDQEAFNIYKCDSDCYNLFNQNLTKYFSKFSNNQVKLLLAPLFDNNLIKIGYPDKNKNLLLGQAIGTYDDKIAGIVINNITHDVDFDGNSLHFEKIIQSIYYIFSEYALRRNFKNELARDKILLQKINHYFNYVLVKSLRLFELYPAKRAIFDFIVQVFFYTKFVGLNINIAYEEAITPGNENIIKSAVTVEKLLKYKTINSMYDALYDFKIVDITPNNMKYMLTSNIGIFAYINIHASLSSLISAFIVSKYKHPNFSSLFISTDMIDGIEKTIIEKYLNNIGFNTTILNNIFDSLSISTTDTVKTIL